MTVLEAIRQSVVRPSVMADKLNLGTKVIERLISKMELMSNGCWMWTAATAGGYGRVHIRNTVPADHNVHRLCYQLVNGPVSRDLHVHHKVEAGCMGRLCCNPEHCEPLTPKEHIVYNTPGSKSYEAVKRMLQDNGMRSQSLGKRPCCMYGHEYTQENTRLDHNGRHCRACERIAAQKVRDRERGTRIKFRWHQDKLKTHCDLGHPLSGENVYWMKTKRGVYPSCRECRRRRQREYIARLRNK